MERAAGSPGTGPGDARGQTREDRDRRQEAAMFDDDHDRGPPLNQYCTLYSLFRTSSNTAYMSGQEAEEEDRHRDGPPPCAGGCLQTGPAAQLGGAAQARQQPGAGHGRGQGLVL